ncbi:hypothetical protein BHE90_003020 [Fusarium euwallaceae]|uniref:Peptidase C14 caspase domain-containing protein n=3 Tax=Fusarium solani species complex TaxID=232080 RepID=A0A430M3Q4_9HYPO|nr:hypothetical protein BHE90_003020 [Fusarium euwallaceae]
MSLTTTAVEPKRQDRWAVVVGIDNYDDGNHLYGCVRDAEDVSAVLQSKLKIPSDNLEVLVSRHGDPIKYSASSTPTRDNVIRALEKLEDKDPGAFVLFYYSGHGGQCPTNHPGLKEAGELDEMICTLEEDIDDVELGRLLNRLAAKHTVLAILDCCHSGGADRAGFNPKEEAIRCKNYDNTLAGNRSAGGNQNDAPASTNSQLYVERQYNLIAACHPNEFAKERNFPKVPGTYCRGGAMTHYFLESLGQFSRSQNLVTYGQLHDVMAAKMKTQATLFQTPLHLGDHNRLLFQSTPGNARLCAQANVISVFNNSVTLNRGSSRHVQVGDRFLLFHPDEAYFGLIAADDSSGIEVEVTKADELQCTAVLPAGSSRSLGSVEPGWFARLSWRSNRKIVHVQFPPDDNNAALERVRQFEANPNAPFKLVFIAPAEPADFTVQIGEDNNFHVHDKTGSLMTNLPLIPAYGKRNVQQLTALLIRLSFYQLLLDMSQGPGSHPTDFRFGLEKCEPDNKNSESLGGWRIVFQNTSPTTLYVTILALGPGYDIEEVFPHQFAQSTELAVSRAIPQNVKIDIEIPGLLDSAKGEKGFQMSDRFIAFVTRTPVSFKEFIQPALVEDADELGSDEDRARVRPPTINLSIVRHAEIITRRLDDGSFTTYDATKQHDDGKNGKANGRHRD